MPLRYFFSFLSKMVYLSLGSISASVGISACHLSTAFKVSPFFAKAFATVSTTLSTARNRCRCLYFWWGERRHGIFLQSKMSVNYDILNNPPVLAYQRRPPPRELVVLNAPNMLTYRGA